MQVSEFGVLHWVKWFYGRCSDRELHLKGSLAMLIRGLQNPFVTRSISFQHKDVERSSYLVFVPSVPCFFFLFTFCLPVASREDCCYHLTENFIRSSCSNDSCEDYVAFLSVVSAYTFFQSNCWLVVISFRMAPKRVPNANPEGEEVPDRPPSPPPPSEAWRAIMQTTNQNTRMLM